MLFGVNWFGFRPEDLAELMEQGEGPARPRQTATLFGQLRDTFKTLASDVDSLLAQLLTAWSSEASESAAQALRRFSKELGDMAAATDTVSQQANAHADANESARSSMPKLEDILEVLASLAAARASQNYGLVTALIALYGKLSTQASSTMQGYEGATVPNLEQSPVQQASPITNPGSSASDVAQLLGSFQPEQSSTSADPMDDLTESTSPTPAELNGGGFGGGGGGFNGIPGVIGLVPGVVAGMTNGFRLEPPAQPRAFGLPSSGVQGMAPTAGVPPGVLGPGGQSRRQRDKERQLPGAVATEDEVPPDIAGLGVVIDVAEPDDVAAPGQHTA